MYTYVQIYIYICTYTYAQAIPERDMLVMKPLTLSFQPPWIRKRQLNSHWDTHRHTDTNIEFIDKIYEIYVYISMYRCMDPHNIYRYID